MDANVNRAREGIRVIEETARMLFDDAVLTARIKHLRHTLIDICSSEQRLQNALVFARGSDRDVLREGETVSEKSRLNPAAVVRANAARAQEAFRSLEEYTKLSVPRISEKFKTLRFELYDIEKSLVSLIRIKEATAFDRLKICAVIDFAALPAQTGADSLRPLVSQILDAGAGSVVYRDNISSDAEFMKNAAVIAMVCAERDASVFIERRLDIAMIADTDGIVLSPGDIPAETCRKIMGPQYAIGITAGPGDNSEETVDPNADFYILDYSLTNELTPANATGAVKEFVAKVNVPVLISGRFSTDTVAGLAENGIRGIWLTPDYKRPETAAEEIRQMGETIDAYLTSI